MKVKMVAMFSYSILHISCVVFMTLPLEILGKESTETKEYFKYKFSVQRNELEEKETELCGYQKSLSKNETIVDSYLEYLKWEEFQATKDAFRPARPVQDYLQQIKGSKVYEVLKKFPKGGNMHVHQNHVISKKKMLDLIFNSPLLQKLCVNVEDSNKKWKLGFYNTAPAGWVKVTSNLALYSKENLIKHITMINTLSPQSIANPTDSGLRWKDLGPVFVMAGTNLVLYQNYTRMHLQAMFESALEENVQYLEARVSGLGMYVLNDSVKDGHQMVDTEDGDIWFRTATEEVNKFQSKHPAFIGYKEIISGSRNSNPDAMDKNLKRAFRLRKKFPNMVKGIDLVSEEDAGYSLLFFIDEFADMYARKKLVPLYLHNAETNWPKDLMTSLHPLDPVSTLENIYEAIILGAKRVGHGLGFIKHPYIMQLLKDRKIAVEVNPVSNMLLGYVTDQRQHPAVTYIRYGIPVVLGADDPGTMGYDEFTVDWYEAFMAWGLRLSDLRTLALNSLRYSTMTSNEKSTAEVKYNQTWNTFITEMRTEACSRDFTSTEPAIHSIFPNEGATTGFTAVRVFGRNFQRSICQRIICRFGDHESNGQYIYNSLIKCNAKGDGTMTTEKFSISLNSGMNFITTNLTFAFMHQQEKKTEGKTSGCQHESPLSMTSYILLACYLFLFI